MRIETDYLVVGAGLAGLAFTDALIEDRNVSVVIVDRRPAPGGHWLEAYPFVRLHQPSRLYGVASTPFGQERLIEHGDDRGLYERAAGSQVCGYFDDVMQQRLLASGQVRFLPSHEYLGEAGVRSRVSGAIHEVVVRKRRVDATYTESHLPGSSPAPFDVADDACCVPPGALSDRDAPPEGYVVIGAGKTAMDTCHWLLAQGYDPDRITWIRPRDMWLLNREHFQGGRFVLGVAEGAAQQFEAAAAHNTPEEVFDQCGDTGVFLRLDPAVRPGMIRGSTSHARELELLRQIRRVIRLGHVTRIERDRIVMERGEVPTSAGHVHVHCAAAGITINPPKIIFGPDQITLQAVRLVSPSFSAALLGFLEGSGRDDQTKNRLAKPNPYMSTPLGWLRATLQSRLTEAAWKGESDLKAWVDGTCLHIGQGMGKLAQTQEGLAVLNRLRDATGPGLENIGRMLRAGPAAEQALFWHA